MRTAANHTAIARCLLLAAATVIASLFATFSFDAIGSTVTETGTVLSWIIRRDTAVTVNATETKPNPLIASSSVKFVTQIPPTEAMSHDPSLVFVKISEVQNKQILLLSLAHLGYNPIADSLRVTHSQREKAFSITDWASNREKFEAFGLSGEGGYFTSGFSFNDSKIGRVACRDSVSAGGWKASFKAPEDFHYIVQVTIHECTITR